MRNPDPGAWCIMTTEPSEHMQPVVLVGGKSRRFGRDKLREPVPGLSGRWLVDVAIDVLRAEFGSVVSVVGECDPLVALRADTVIPDRYPGVGPMGGLLSALEHSCGPVLALPGDVWRIDIDLIRRLRSAADLNPADDAVLLRTDQVQWCAGVYRPSLAGVLRTAVASGRYALRDVLSGARITFVDLGEWCFEDADRPDDLRRL
ncbi:MAG: molybdenum cofactor guanylyltransferase [Phycisphaerales bacterium]|nr:molybdenum cofactor guanylyltransferase [Phycisphaerales bacterium]